MKNSTPKQTKIPLYLHFPIMVLVLSLGIGSSLHFLSKRTLPSFLPIEIPETWNFETQIKLFAKVAFFAGSLIFINSSLIIVCRGLFWKIEPHKGEEPLLITILNQVLRNSVEQTIPFLCSFLYWILNKTTADDIRLAYCFAFFFLAFRVIFLLGYVTGVFLPITALRAIGFSGAIVVQIALLAGNLGHNLV